jgi:hypothetical protein
LRGGKRREGGNKLPEDGEKPTTGRWIREASMAGQKKGDRGGQEEGERGEEE